MHVIDVRKIEIYHVYEIMRASIFFLFPVEFSILLISSLFLFDQQSTDSDMKEELENQF